MARRSRRSATVLLMGAALSAAPLGLATIVTPAISHAECGVDGGGGYAHPTGGGIGGGTVSCEAEPAPAPADSEPKNEWGFNPNLTPAENLARMPAPALQEPLVQTSLIDDVPVQISPELGLPGIGVGVNLWPDLTPIVNGVVGAGTGAAVAGLPAPNLDGVGAALQQLPPPQLPDLTKIPPPKRIIPLQCGPQITPFFKPCI
jgi:hypothetical protein